MSITKSTQEDTIIDVLTGEIKVGKAPATLQCLALGSCVAVILYDKEHAIGGIAHVMLPFSNGSNHRDADAFKYANNSIPELLKQMREQSADTGMLVACLAGGALVIADTPDIGKENIDAVHGILKDLGIPIMDERVGGTAGRSVIFNIVTGELQINGETIPFTGTPSSFTEEKKLMTGSSGELPGLEKIVGEKKELDNRTDEINDIRKATFNLLEDLEKERESLVEAKAKNDAMLASIGDGFAVADESGKSIYLNKPAEDILGTIADQNSPDTGHDGYGIFDPVTFKLYPPDQMPLFLATKGRIVNKVQLFIKNKKMPEGKFITVTATPIFLNDKSIGGVAVFRDMTKEMQVDKAKTEFVSLASHQLRTPLTSVNWYSEMLLNTEIGKSIEKQKEYLKKIHAGSERMVVLVNALLNVSRIEIGSLVVEPKPVNVTELLASVIGEQKSQINEKKITLSDHFSKEVSVIKTDPGLLRMVFQNLLSNAVKYTPPGGKIDISASLDADDAVLIAFSDTGYGIPKKDHDQIFTKMFRADNIKEKGTDGTGLGLYIVKSVLESLGGGIRFASEENKGSTFSVTLPRAGPKKKEIGEDIIHT